MLSTLDANDTVALGALSEETCPRRVEEWFAPDLDESAARRAVRYPVSRQGRILVLSAEAITRRERYGVSFSARFSVGYTLKDVWQNITLVTHPDHRVGRRGSQLSICALDLVSLGCSDDMD